MHKPALTLAAALLLAAANSQAQVNGEPDNDWLMKHPVPSGERIARERAAAQAQSAPPVQPGAAAPMPKQQDTGARDSSYGRP
ncbi:MAG TPA: hypothetical protein VGN52_16900 [Burkholderiales bacterium]|jgi:hypothetical protein